MRNKVVVITGANKGLGYSTVKGLCQKYNGIVYLTARDENRGQNAVLKLKEVGLKPVFHQLDISDRNSVKKFAEFLKETHDGFDILVNNAAVLVWDEIYPSYEVAKQTIDINYKGLLLIEEYLYPLLRKDARVVNVSSPCAWIKILKNSLLKVEEINEFVDEYLESVKCGTFRKSDVVDNGKHAEYRVSKIAFTALTMLQQRKYKNLSINAVDPGHMKTDMSNGGGIIDADDGAKIILHLILNAPLELKGSFIWSNSQVVDWTDSDTDLAPGGVW